MVEEDFIYCRNRRIVKAGTRLSHTFPADLGFFEYESVPETIVCTEWMCGASDVNAWVRNAGKFIDGRFADQIRDTTKAIKKKQGGLLREDQAAVLKHANETLAEWREFAIETPAGDHPVSPLSEYEDLSIYWRLVFPGNAFMQDIFTIIDMFENASCSMDAVRKIHPKGVYIDPGPPAAQPDPPSGRGGSFFGGADDPIIGWKGGAGLAIGIGLAGFVAWKAMTS